MVLIPEFAAGGSPAPANSRPMLRLDGLAPGDTRAEVYRRRGAPESDGWRGLRPDPVPATPLWSAPVCCYPQTTVVFRDDAVVDIWGQVAEKDGSLFAPTDTEPGDFFHAWDVRPRDEGLSLCTGRSHPVRLRPQRNCKRPVRTLRERVQASLKGGWSGLDWCPSPDCDPTQLAQVRHLLEATPDENWFKLSWTEAGLREALQDILEDRSMEAGYTSSDYVLPTIHGEAERRGWVLARAQAGFRRRRGEAPQVYVVDEIPEAEAWDALQRLSVVGQLANDMSWQSFPWCRYDPQPEERVPMTAFSLRLAAALARVVDAGRNPEILSPDPIWQGIFDVTRSLGGADQKPLETRVGAVPADLAWDFEDGGAGRLLLLATRTQANLGARPFRDYLTPLQQAWPELERAEGPCLPEESRLARQLEELYHLGEPHRVILRLVHLAQERPSGLLGRALARAIREHLQLLGVPER